jgi:protein-tyrosine phosphatase
MIDLHCHILPDLDDGPETMEEAVEMCRVAAADGITSVVATPHYRPGWFESTAAARSARVAELRAELLTARIPLTVLQGAELSLSPELPELLSRAPDLTINGTGRYFLVELPFHAEPPKWGDFLQSLTAAGTVPVLAHPERSAWLHRKPEQLLRFVKAGGLVQITGGSLLGEEGKDVREFSLLLLKHRLVHAIASDAHSAVDRLPRLAQAVKAAAEAVGLPYADDLVNRHPGEITSGQPVSAPQPLEPAYARAERASKRWFFFR